MLASRSLTRPLWWLMATWLVLLLWAADSWQGDVNYCDNLFRTKNKLNSSDPNCSDETGLLNMPILGGAYCSNDGTGNCKAFAGQFEFTFNTKTGQYLDPVPKSKFVDANGYHQRVPAAYDINGEIFYHDRPINYASELVRKWNEAGRRINLLNQTDFNWCFLVANNYWPYKSAIKDYKSNGRYHIYFSHKQSCIIDTQSSKRQHYNTRFQHNTWLRIDLDANPLIFAMEDHLANEVRLVKNKRQHWYEVAYRVIENPAPNVHLFLKIDNDEKLPCIVDGKGPLLKKSFYANKTNVCLSDGPFQRSGDSKNNNVMAPKCGVDQVEIADYTYPNFVLRKEEGNLIHEVDLHNIPRHPRETELFYDIHIKNTEEWEMWVKDGFSFTAATTIPIETSKGEMDPNKVRVIMLYSHYKRRQASSAFDEHYPNTLLSDFEATYYPENPRKPWVFDRESKAKELRDLNYVDDIAYLHKCKTVLIIFGPFYQELPKDRFNLQHRAPVGSIVDLGAFEMVNAFFAVPDENTIWFYHRTNYVQQIKYTCGDGKNTLVTGERVGGYFDHSGAKQTPFWDAFSQSQSKKDPVSYYEELVFKEMGLFKGEASRSPPDPRSYPLSSGDAPAPEEEKSNTLVYVLVGIGVILILLMLLLSFIVVRRRLRKHRHRKNKAAAGSSTGSGISGIRTNRSGMSSGAGQGSGPPTARSSYRSSASGASGKMSTGPPTARSGFGSQSSRSKAGPPTARSSYRSNASGASSASGAPGSTVRSKALGGGSPSGSVASASSKSSHASRRR